MKKALILVVNYKTETEILSFVKNLSEQSAKDSICVAVTDNGKDLNSGINLEEALKETDIDCSYYNFNENLGYLNGCLYGLEEYLKNNSLPDWVIISNTDIIIEDKCFFERFFENNYDNDVWGIAPSVVDIDGNYCNPQYKQRIPEKKIRRLIKIYKHSLTAKLYTFASILKRRKSRTVKEASQFVYSAHGCFFALKKEFFEYLSGEKYGAFLYSEESYVAEKIRLAGKKMFYDSEIEVKHLENVTTKKINIGRKKKYTRDSLIYILNNFYK